MGRKRKILNRKRFIFSARSILGFNGITLLFFLLSNISFGQSESRKAFVLTLNVPNNERNSNSAFKEIASENDLKRLACYQDNEIQSDLYFDKFGNVITNIDYSNKIISKSEFEYDAENRITKICYYDSNDDFKYGYIYEYNGLSKIKYEIGNSDPLNREIELKDENIRIYSRYTSKGWILSGIYIKNSNGEYDRELAYNDEGLYQEFQHSYDSIKLKGITKKINYRNGLKTSEKDYYAYKTDKRGNKIERYSAYANDALELISTHKFNEQNQIIENDFPSVLETFEYNDNGLLKSKITKDRNGITILKFYYQNSLPQKIIKTSGENESLFNYKYEFFE